MEALAIGNLADLESTDALPLGPASHAHQANDAPCDLFIFGALANFRGQGMKLRLRWHDLHGRLRSLKLCQEWCSACGSTFLSTDHEQVPGPSCFGAV